MPHDKNHTRSLHAITIIVGTVVNFHYAVVGLYIVLASKYLQETLNLKCCSIQTWFHSKLWYRHPWVGSTTTTQTTNKTWFQHFLQKIL